MWTSYSQRKVSAHRQSMPNVLVLPLMPPQVTHLAGASLKAVICITS